MLSESESEKKRRELVDDLLWFHLVVVWATGLICGSDSSDYYKMNEPTCYLKKCAFNFFQK